MLVVKPDGEREAARARSCDDVVREAFRKSSVDQISSGSRLSHEPCLRYVDAAIKPHVYILRDDAEWPTRQTVDMRSQPHPNHLRDWREFREMTQDQLADAVKCSKASIGHWENGERRLTDKWLPALSKALGTQPGYILDHAPLDLPTDILDTWASIPEAKKADALRMLKALAQTG